MGDDEDRSDLWSEAWSRPEPPPEEPLRPRAQWQPGSHSRGGNAGSGARDQRHSRRVGRIGGRDDHLTFEPPEEYRPDRVTQHTDRSAHGAAARDATRGRRAQEAAKGRGRPGPTPILPGGAHMPRGTVVGYRRRTPSRALIAVIAIIVIALGAVLAWWFLTRPAALALTPSPSDATVTIAGHAPRTGTLVLEDIEPGTLTVTVARTGFATATVQVEIPRGRRTERTVTLSPLPFKLKVTTRPSGATVKVTSSTGTVLRGTTPCSIVASAGAVTVTISRSGSNTFKQNVFLDSARTLDVLLDPKGQLVHALGSLTAKGAPKGVSVTPDGREAWASILNGPPSIEIYDLKAMRKTGGIDLGKHGAVEIIFNRAGTLAYASQMETAKVFEIDTATRKVTRSFKTESSWTKVIALSPDEKTLYAANWSGNDVSIIDLTAGTLKERIPTAKTPRGLWPTKDGRYLYVAGFAHGELQRIDLTSGTVKTLFTSGGALRHLVADEERGVLYASDMSKDVVWVLDLQTLKVKKFCDTDHKPNTIELSPDGQILFISNRGENNPKSYYIPGYEWGTILLISTSSGRPLDAIVGGNQCTALDVSADGHTLVFSDFLDDRLRVYDVPGYATLAQGGGGRYAAHFADLKKSRP